VSDGSRWLRPVTCAALVILVVAVIQPALGGLLLRAFAIATVLAVGVVAVGLPLQRLIPATDAGRRAERRAPADVPRQLDAIAGALRTMDHGDPVPELVLRPLRASLEHRLRAHHHLAAGQPGGDDELRRLLSGRAHALLTTAPPFSPRPLVISRDELAALIAEVEAL
jgi:hypothetical protein